MIIYQYDGSIDGFLTSVCMALEKCNDAALFAIKSNAYQMSFDTKMIDVESNIEQADSIIASLNKIISRRGVSDILHAFDSCDTQKDVIIYNYIRLALKTGKSVLTMQSHPYVVLYNDIVHKVRNEIHRMSGFIRFVKTKSETYYAAYSPENNITHFLMPEFISRYPIMSFVLHDVTRGIAGIYNGDDYIMIKDATKATIEYAEGEQQLTKLWQKYYESVNIKERYNRRLMLNYMPRKYVENIHTFNDFKK